MNRSQGPRRALSIWVLLLCLAGAALVLTILNGSFDGFVAIALPMMLGYGTIGAFVAAKVPANPLGWLMLTVGVSFGMIGLSDEYLVWAVRNDAPLQALAAWLTNWVFVVTFAPLPAILLLFPTGRVLSPRWRIVLYAIAVGAASLAISSWIRPGEVDADTPFANPTGVEALEPLSALLASVGSLAIIAGALAAVVALVLRYRTSVDVERRQIRALAYVAGGSVVLLVGSFVTSGPGDEQSQNVLNQILFYAFFVCIGIAFPGAIGYSILRHRLYDIDLVVKKTVTYSLVAVALTGLYLAFVTVATLVNFSRLFFAVVLLALTFQPVRRAARSIADRLIYGRRATPYEVMSEFSERMSDTYSTDDVLPRMAQVLQGATGATRADVWLRVGRQLRASASSPGGESPHAPVAAPDDSSPALPGSFAAEVRHQGTLLGALSVEMPSNDPLDPSRERLVRDLAAQAGPVLRNVRLIEELRASRQRLVAAQDDERRKLERNIHDGAQQQLVALGVKLRLADTLVDRDADEGARDARPAPDRDPRCDRRPARPRARHLPAAPRRPGARLGARGTSPEVGRARAGRGRRGRPLRPGRRGGRLLLVPRGAAEHREVLGRLTRHDLVGARQRIARVLGGRRRGRLRCGFGRAWHGAAGHGRPHRRDRRFVHGRE